MHLNAMLQLHGIDPTTVPVMRHRPPEPQLRKILPWLAAERQSTFNAYQQTQSSKTAEDALGRATFMASFIGHEPTRAVFVGLYRRGASKPLSYDEYWKKSEYSELKKFGLGGFQGDRKSILFFDLQLMTDFYGYWAGKLITKWPGGERRWWRWANRNTIDVMSILEQSALISTPKDWRDMVLSWSELQLLPSALKASLAEWRGIYFIFDQSDGRGYVGSAYGAENILGRWLNYKASGHGGNSALRNRDPSNFRFSILERVSPDLPVDQVVRIEDGWKVRLHTRHFGLNRN